MRPRPELRLDRPVTSPGSPLVVVGAGCDPGAPVSVEVAGRLVSSTTADASGSFSGSFDLPSVDVGRYPVVAMCGPVITAAVDLILVSRVEPASSTLAVLAFFILLVLAAIRRRIREVRIAFRR